MDRNNRGLKTVLAARLAEVKRSGLYRRLRSVTGAQDEAITLDGREVLLLSSNNYLGLANHPVLKRAAQDAINHYGCGAGTSRLISGNMAPHQKLEQRLATFKKAEAALVFPTGYHANIGILSLTDIPCLGALPFLSLSGDVGHDRTLLCGLFSGAVDLAAVLR